MSGILDQILNTTGFGSLSTSDYRNMLLGRNLPPPISEAIKESKFASMALEPKQVIDIDDPSDENIRAIYALNKIEGKLLEGNSETVREDLTLKNRFKPLNGYTQYDIIYTPYINSIALSLGLIDRGGSTLPTRGEYPTYSNTDQFSLLSNGDRPGVSYPYTAIELSKLTDLQSESLLGLSSAKYLQESIALKVAQIENENNPKIDRTGTITPPGNPDTVVGSYIDILTGFGYINHKNLSQNSVGWQEFNSSPKKNKESALIDRINQDLGNYDTPTLSTEGRVDDLLTRTSDTQVGFLLNALEMNLYVPNYSDRRLVGTPGAGTNSRYYIGNSSSTNRGGRITKTFLSSDFNSNSRSLDVVEQQKETTVDEKFKWEKENPNNFNEKTILYNTQNLATSLSDYVWIDQTDKFFKDKVNDRLISRGNAISSQEFIDADFNGNYCRVWTVTDHYAYHNAIRNTGLFTQPQNPFQPRSPGFSATAEKASLSVLGDNGIVRSHPTKEDSETTFKKYMFSIENLAWADNLADLPLSEIGPGDLLSSNKGRIMWFPPYDLSFDENVSAKWTPTEFIGRGEPLYTYNNTERSGQIRFKMLVDHPRVVNGYRGKRSNAIERFFAGCLSPDNFLNILDTNAGVSKNTKEEIKKKLNGIRPQKRSNTEKNKKTYVIYFKDEPFAGSGLASVVEGDPSTGISGGGTLNADAAKIITDAAKDNKKTKVTCVGFVGKSEKMVNKKEETVPITAIKAKKVGRDRAKTVMGMVENTFTTDTKTRKFINKSIQSKGYSLSTSEAKSSDDYRDRRVELTIENDSLNTPATEHAEDLTLGDLTFYPGEIQLLDSLIINETNYFDFVDFAYPNYFANISEKIKYFHPGFHSTTPEGLNTRVTFLQQCMRQGPSINDKADKIQPQNLSFGRPPVLILRIGDFFYTKVVCNTMNITYESGGNIQWDMNPSGIGVQPMVANVTMSVNIIGGQSLQGPINRLQNAVSFNYYANTEMYDARSESIKLTSEGAGIVEGLKLGQLKETALIAAGREGGLDTLTASIKGEGILNQKIAEEKAAAAELFATQFGIKIDRSNPILVTTDYQGHNIIVQSLNITQGGKVGTATLPSDMPSAASAAMAFEGTGPPKPLENNLLVVEVKAKYSNKSIFKKIYKEEFDLKSVEITSGEGGITPFLFKFFDSEISVKNNEEIKQLELDINGFKKKCTKTSAGRYCWRRRRFRSASKYVKYKNLY